jgi:N-acyl homoserine lactone hydrolase
MIGLSDIGRLWLGYYTMPPDTELAGEKIVVCAYLIRHPEGLILFDTGIGEGHEESERLFQPVRWPLEERLQGVDVGIADISRVANCHFHLDHCGSNPRFPGRPIFAQRGEYEAAQEGREEYTIPSLIDFDGARLELHGGEADIAKGVRIIPTPGHTPGHQSLIVDTTEGRVLLAGQLVGEASDFGRMVTGAHLERAGLERRLDRPEWFDRVMELDPQFVFFAHDVLQWQRSDVPQ